MFWLLRGLKPDFKTIADFRRDNAKAFRIVIRQFALRCRKLDLCGLNFSPTTERGSGPSTTRIAISRAARSSQFLRVADERLARLSRQAKRRR